MQKEINHQWIYEQSPAEVWEYLTRAELMELWLMPNDFKLELGHEFQFTTKPMPALNLDGRMYCKVLEIVPMKKLVYSWKAGSGDGVFTLNTTVVWTLEPDAKGTKLKLKHSGFTDDNAQIFIGMTDGWMKLVGKMMAILNPQP